MTAGRFDRWRGIWLGAALVLTTATQLRFGSVPIGPGELLLGAWLLLGGATLAVGGIRRPSLGGGLLLGFWGVGAGALALGWIVGLARGDSTIENGRDAVAFGLVTAMLLVLVLDRGYSAVAGWAARTVAVLGVISMTALAIAMLARRGGAVGPVEPLYGDARFRGWAENPNQLALLLLTVPLMAVAFAAQGRPGRRVLWIGFGLMAIGLGVLTGSDALKAAWVALGALVAVFGWSRLALGPFARRVPTALLAIGAPIAVGVGVLAGGGRAVELSTEVIGETFAVGGQGEDRVGRWLFALDALEGSPAVGLGPGAFSGGSAPFQGQEAHNSVVDWAVSTGALGFAALLALTFGGALALALRRQRFSGAVGVSLVLFASLHYVFRQPLAWFLVFALFEGIFDRPREPEARRAD